MRQDIYSLFHSATGQNIVPNCSPSKHYLWAYFFSEYYSKGLAKVKLKHLQKALETRSVVPSNGRSENEEVRESYMAGGGNFSFRTGPRWMWIQLWRLGKLINGFIYRAEGAVFISIFTTGHNQRLHNQRLHNATHSPVSSITLRLRGSPVPSPPPVYSWNMFAGHIPLFLTFSISITSAAQEDISP